MAYGKYKMVMNPKGAEEARRKQDIPANERRIRNPKKKQPIVKFGKASDMGKTAQNGRPRMRGGR